MLSSLVFQESHTVKLTHRIGEASQQSGCSCDTLACCIHLWVSAPMCFLATTAGVQRNYRPSERDCNQVCVCAFSFGYADVVCEFYVVLLVLPDVLLLIHVFSIVVLKLLHLLYVSQFLCAC